MLEIIIAIAGLFIAWITYVKTFHAKPNDEKETFLAYFLATQKLSKEVYELVHKYATEHNAMNIDLFKGVTYKAYLAALLESKQINLSDELFHKLQSMDLTKIQIATLQKELENQNIDLLKMKSLFIMASKQ